MSMSQLPRAMRCARPRRQLSALSGTSGLATSVRRAPQEPRASPREEALTSAAQSGPRRRKIQTWQALLLGSLATVAIQGVLLSAGGAGSGNAENVNGRVTKTSSRTDKTAAAIPRLEEALERIASAGIEVSTAEDVLTGFATAPGTSYAPSLPLAVTYPTSTEDVVQIVNACRASKVPMIPISGRTSLEGHTIALQERGSALIISLDRMDKILEVNEMNGDAVVQVGVGWEALNEHLTDQGIPLFFPVDPGPGAAFGGMIACGGSGTHAVRYGTMKSEVVINATVVLATGEVIKTRSRSRKSAMGYDATKLFIGAEGTLGIVTECTVRLSPKLPVKVATTAFENVDAAVQTVVELLNKGVQVTCVELLDEIGMRAVNMSGQISHTYPEKPHLFLKFSGGPGTMQDNISLANGVLKKHKGTPLVMARDEAENEEIWQARKGLFFSQQLLVPGCKVYITDAAVPLSRLPELVKETAKDIKASGFVAPIVGHSGDGNIHATILYRPDQSYAEVKALARRIGERAIALEGTASGEHGVGQSKREFMVPELGLGTVRLMRTIKQALDPEDLFNPGKLLPDEEA